MPLSLKRSFLAACASFLTLSAHAELKWETQMIETAAQAGDEAVKTTYRFTNAGDRPVTILAVNSSCDCTVPALLKKTYASGESGHVDVVFKTTGRFGRQEKILTVITDDPTTAPTVLTLRVKIPELILIEPRIFHWKAGEPATAKEAVITAGSEIEIDVRDAQASTPDFIVTLTPETAGRRYRLKVTPKSTEVNVHTMITLHFEAIIGRPETRSLYAFVQ